MILIIGGAFQGKRAYADRLFSLEEKDWKDGAELSFEELCKARAVDCFQEFIKKSLREGREVRELAERLFASNPELIVVCNELGSGVIPTEAFDREWREATGRVCCELALRSGEVHRVVCGIGTVIKGEAAET